MPGESASEQRAEPVTGSCRTSPRKMLLKNDCIQRRSEIRLAAKKRIAHARRRWAPCFRLAFVVSPVASLAGALKFQRGSTGHVFPVQLPWLRLRKPRQMVADWPASLLPCVRKGGDRSGADGTGRRGIHVEIRNTVCMPGLSAQLRCETGTYRAEDPVQWLRGGCESAGGQFIPRRPSVARCAQRDFRQRPRHRSGDRAYERGRAAGGSFNPGRERVARSA